MNKLLYKQWCSGTVLIIPTEMAVRIPGAHFSPQHWTTKQGKACGRSLCDVANSGAADDVPVNNGRGNDGKERVRQQMIREWGAINHPTVNDLALMIWAAMCKFGADNLELWKLDLAGAFNLLDFHWSSAMLLFFELTQGMSVAHITGMFGWTGTPYCFQVITRILTRLCRKAITGSCCWYVDDCMGISLKASTSSDVTAAVTQIEGLLGPGAVAPDKHDQGRRIVCLGWTFDLDLQSVTISHRNLLKGLHAFFSLDVNTPVLLHAVERMASLSSRYAMLCRPLKPFTVALVQAHSWVSRQSRSQENALCSGQGGCRDVESVPLSATLRRDTIRPPPVLLCRPASFGSVRVRRVIDWHWGWSEHSQHQHRPVGPPLLHRHPVPVRC